MNQHERQPVIVVGGGFSGLAAAYELAKRGVAVTLIEAEKEVGGLAAAFDVEGERLDRFYHHWFTNDHHIMELVEELGASSRVCINPTNTGMYYANNFFKLSTPVDLLRFSALPFIDRIRLGLLALRARRVKNWQSLEQRSATDWLIELGGKRVYQVVWEPLLKGKFGAAAERVSAVWFWNKLKLRGSSRGKGGEEQLAYFKGGFAALAEAIAARIRALGGTIITGQSVIDITPNGSEWRVTTSSASFITSQVIATPALPLIAKLIGSWADDKFLAHLQRIEYLANVCLVMELDHSLSETYWLNVNDPDFPFVGVIEHTNFEPTSSYGGRHIVYLSKYLPETDALYAMNTEELFNYALPYLHRMFPDFKTEWVHKLHLWKARWAQPLVEKNYSQLLATLKSSPKGLHLCSMAQVYPEDRGTNYAVREGRASGEHVAKLLQPDS